MQYHSPNATLGLDSCCQQCILSPLGGSTYLTLFTIQLNAKLLCFILLSCPPNYTITIDADKRIDLT